ncbi:MAG: hypothetical protein ABIW85_11410 [Variovorax sp.]
MNHLNLLAADLYFFRDNDGVEAGLLYKNEAGRLQGVELKSGATFVPEWAQPARRAAGYLAAQTAPEPLVVYGGNDSFWHNGGRVVRWRDIEASRVGQCCARVMARPGTPTMETRRRHEFRLQRQNLHAKHNATTAD